MVGVKAKSSGGFNVYAPHGLEDLDQIVVRPNVTPNFQTDRYRSKAARWLRCWRELKITYPVSNVL